MGLTARMNSSCIDLFELNGRIVTTRQSKKMPEFDYDWIPICQFMSLQKLALNACLMNIMTRIGLNIEFVFDRSFDLMLQRAIFPIVCSSHV